MLHFPQPSPSLESEADVPQLSVCAARASEGPSPGVSQPCSPPPLMRCPCPHTPAPEEIWPL